MLALASLAVAGASLAVVAPAPSYDPWAWLLWGREVTELRLSTPEGPAFKPLPVAVCAMLAPFGDAAPWLWVLLARAAAAAALLFAFRLGRRLADGWAAGGLLCAAVVLVTGEFAAFASAGVSEGILLCFALAGLEAYRAGHPRAAIACAAACALLRVETWPLLVLAGIVAWHREPAVRALIAAVAVLVPVAWFLPELLGSGDLLRSGERARIPNPGQPALAPVPALASLSEALGLVPWPVWVGLVALPLLWRSGRPRRPPRAAPVDHPFAPAAVGFAWIAIVAAMAQAGFSGEARYAMPGAALIGISGACGLPRAAARLPFRPAVPVIAVALAGLVIAPHLERLRQIAPAQAYQWRLAQDLEAAIAQSGGRERILACGRPYVGRLRGPLMAYALNVAKSRVEPDAAPTAPGVVFRSRLTARADAGPVAPSYFAHVAHVGKWQIRESCRDDYATARVRVP